MTSILTNVAAMAALQTLRSIGSGMEETQARVSSGLRVGEASDNAAYWSIATTMRSDNGALSAVQDALGLGAAKVDTAYAGMESAIEVVKEIKNKLVASREAGVDKAKIQEEITQLQDQLKSIASSASFSGENWLQTSIGEAATATTDGVVAIDKQVVGSFTRDSSGNVSVKTIDLELNDSNVLFDTSGNNRGILDAEALTLDQAKVDVAGVTRYYDAVNSDTVDDTFSENSDGLWTDGAAFYLKVDNDKWVETDGAGAITATEITDYTTLTYVTDLSVSELDITDLSAYAGAVVAGASDEEILDHLIQYVDTQLETMTSAASELGSVNSRIELQEEFVSKLTDSIDSGIGRLVDADMNEESTRLKALQTQQQLAIQALSIANSDSQNILSLFR